MSIQRSPTVLIIDDNRRVLEESRDLFSDDFEVLTASSGAEGIEVISSQKIATVVVDIKMSGMDGIETAEKIQELSPETSIILHTAYAGEYDEEEIDEISRPYDYVVKGDSIAHLKRAVRNGVERHFLRFGNQRAFMLETMCGMIGRSKAMQEVYHLLLRAAESDQIVLLLGEMGTGKELAAQAIYNNNLRRTGKMVNLRCSPRSSQIIDSELFGHTKGAFTGADQETKGLFAEADGGVLFLDEIGDLDPNTQTKLLNVIENGQYRRLGESIERKADVQVVCATNKDILGMIEEGTFRVDLYHRINGIVIEIPPLRARKEDIPLLVKKFVESYVREKKTPARNFDDDAIDALIQYDWPGNVRELLKTVERILALCDGRTISATDATPYIGDGSNEPPSGVRPLDEYMGETERTYIVRILNRTRGNVTEAASLLGKDRSNLQKRIKKYGIDMSSFKS